MIVLSSEPFTDRQLIQQAYQFQILEQLGIYFENCIDDPKQAMQRFMKGRAITTEARNALLAATPE
jgi:hypothetical protein